MQEPATFPSPAFRLMQELETLPASAFRLMQEPEAFPASAFRLMQEPDIVPTSAFRLMPDARPKTFLVRACSVIQEPCTCTQTVRQRVTLHSTTPTVRQRFILTCTPSTYIILMKFLWTDCRPVFLHSQYCSLHGNIVWPNARSSTHVGKQPVRHNLSPVLGSALTRVSSECACSTWSALSS